jgi:hypothetical protein
VGRAGGTKFLLVAVRCCDRCVSAAFGTLFPSLLPPPAALCSLCPLFRSLISSTCIFSRPKPLFVLSKLSLLSLFLPQDYCMSAICSHALAVYIDADGESCCPCRRLALLCFPCQHDQSAETEKESRPSVLPMPAATGMLVEEQQVFEVGGVARHPAASHAGEGLGGGGGEAGGGFQKVIDHVSLLLGGEVEIDAGLEERGSSGGGRCGRAGRSGRRTRSPE